MMRRIYKVLMVMVCFFVQLSVANAQTNGVVDAPEVYGLYDGVAKTTLSKKGGSPVPGADKKITIEIRKGVDGYTLVSLKDISVGKYQFEELPFEECILRSEKDRWQIYLESNLHNEFTTKDKRYKVTIGGNIDENNSFVYKNGTLELDFELYFDNYENTAAHKFTGKKRVASGITNVEGEHNKPTIIYDLQGRRVEKPAKGIYIVNGKKVVY